MHEHCEIELCGERLWLLADRALYWPARKTLLLADVGLGRTLHTTLPVDPCKGGGEDVLAYHTY